MDGNTANKTYPRSSDPTYNQQIAIDAVGATTITVNVGASPIVNHTVTNATYDPIGGDLVLTIGAHTLAIGESIKIATGSLTFSCDQGGTVGNGSYPRATGANTSDGEDYAYDTAVEITAASETTITVNVNGGQGAVTNTNAHTFVSATPNGIQSGGNYTHTFVSASANSVSEGGGLAYINSLATVTDGTYEEGENIRVYKFGYKDRGGLGFFTPGNTVKGHKSGAKFSCKGANSGLRWLYTNALTGTFQNREYILSLIHI